MYIHLDELGAQLGSLLATLLNNGFRPPIYLVCIDANGNLIATHYRETGEGDLKPVFVAEYVPDGGITMPVKLFSIDSATGRAAAFTMENDVVTGNWIN